MSDESRADRIARDLGIEQVPEFWRTHWQAFEEWRSSGGCGVLPGEFPSNARDVFGLPPECILELESVCKAIRVNPVLADLANLYHFLMCHLPGGRGLSEDILPAPVGALGERAPAFRIAALVSCTDHALEAYRTMGVSDEIALDSLRQAGTQMTDHYATHGVWGMRYLGWTRNYLRALLFRIGRLAFNTNDYDWGFHVYRHRITGEPRIMCAAGQVYRTDGMADGTNGINDPNAWVSQLEITPDFVRGTPVSPTGEAVKQFITLDTREWTPLIGPGDHVIEIHIPGYTGGGKLGWDDCVESYRRALDFFPRYYPNLNLAAFTCWSWLLDPGLARILPPESNIVRFQSPFHRLPVLGNENQCYDIVFGDGNADISTAPRNTALQRAIIEYVSAGNRMRSAAGFIMIDEMRVLAGTRPAGEG